MKSQPYRYLLTQRYIYILRYFEYRIALTDLKRGAVRERLTVDTLGTQIHKYQPIVGK